MSRADRRYRYTPTPDVADWVTCEPCGKRSYRTRALAKREARRLKSIGSGNLTPCPCPVDPDAGWHVGHLPAKVKNGARTREYLQSQARRREA